MHEDRIIHDVDRLIELFDDTFFDKYNTRLIKGGEEPIYLPADAENAFHQIVFRSDYFSSALHEIAHWCIAGPERRLKKDYGYWYAPDDRDRPTQKEFYKVEELPQAIEWGFCLACGVKFNISMDNLNGDKTDELAFTSNVAYRLSKLLSFGFPPRAEYFIDVLRKEYFPKKVFTPKSRAQLSFETTNSKLRNSRI